MSQLPCFTTVNLFQLWLTVNPGKIQLTKFVVNGREAKDGWGTFVRNAHHEGGRADVYIYTINNRHQLVSVLPINTPLLGICPHHEPDKYTIIVAIVDGYIPMYTCVCNRTDGLGREADTIRYVDILENQFVAFLPSIESRFKQWVERVDADANRESQAEQAERVERPEPVK